MYQTASLTTESKALKRFSELLVRFCDVKDMEYSSCWKRNAGEFRFMK